jgi:hypothetical protein
MDDWMPTSELEIDSTARSMAEAGGGEASSSFAPRIGQREMDISNRNAEGVSHFSVHRLITTKLMTVLVFTLRHFEEGES